VTTDAFEFVDVSDRVRCPLPILGAGPAAGKVTLPPESVRTTVATRRQRWAVETMAVAPHDRVLEIGCGRGAAVSLVAERLTTGTIVAIDRSATMVRLATERNADHVRAGRAQIRRAAFESAELPERHFTKIFAVNVNLFWLGAEAAQIDRMTTLLAPGGALYVFGERPESASPTAIVTSVEGLLRAHGFATATTVARSGAGRVLTCVAGTPVR